MALPKPVQERLAFGGGGNLQRRVGTARNGQKFRWRTHTGALSRRGEGEKEGVPRSSHKAARRITPHSSFGLADTTEYTGSASQKRDFTNGSLFSELTGKTDTPSCTRPERASLMSSPS